MENSNTQPMEEEASNIINILEELNSNNPVDFPGNLNELYTSNLERTYSLLESKGKSDILLAANTFIGEDDSIEWKYLLANFSCIRCLKLTNPAHISVQQAKILRNVFRNIIGIGIASNLRPNLPYYINLHGNHESSNVISDLTHHKRLVATTKEVLLYLKCPLFRPIIVSEYLKYVLSAFYQIIYCPFKKPNDKADLATGFLMTQEIYNRLVIDRETFKRIFPQFSSSIHISLYVRETMMLLNKSSPNWMKKALSNTLSELIRGPKGLESISCAMLDAAGVEDSCDSTKSWKTLDVIAKIVLDSRKLPDFRENICRQLRDLLKSRSKSGEPVKSFERLFVLCTKLLYQQDESLCWEAFITHLLKPLICFTNGREAHVTNEGSVTESVAQSLSLLRSLIVEGDSELPCLPAKVVFSISSVLFQIECAVIDSSLKEVRDDIKSILVKVLSDAETNLKFSILDNLLFDFPHEDLLKLQATLEFYVESDLLKVRNNEHVVTFGPLARAEVLKRLVKENFRVTSIFFSYLLNCLVEREKYRATNETNKDLLGLEEEIVLNERDIAIYKVLSELIEDGDIQKQINKDPEEIIRYIQNVLEKAIGTKLHKSSEFESDHFQFLFLVVMILRVLSDNIKSCDRYSDLIRHLKVIKDESGNKELAELSKEILTKLTDQVKKESVERKPAEESELEKALEDICDPLIPVRGHGLMMLTKLVEKKDKNTLERKQFILNIFQQNLKNEDSFIYLSAIGGLAAMADVFPDTVLKALAEEYCDFIRKDGHEIRVKVGEVLVRVVRTLGEMAPKYKSLLLNTFLAGAKDEDSLTRASSLSNLGEVCKVLGYKLGSIVTEVLVCVHAIISTDKAAEARRAAVTVVRQLFVGLEKEMIVFLKDDILPLYRALKHIYYHDSDDVMKLQAQLALEQLNENMKDFVFPNVQLHDEKKIILLN